MYGFIKVTDCEQKIIDTPQFQRLRRINQLGTTFLVYPSAQHTRFEHSLGTMFIIDKMFESVLTNFSQEIFQWSKKEIEYYQGITRLSALLHDLGHPPFSHASEDLFPFDKNEKRLEHEDYTYRLIVETDLSHCIDKCYGKDTARLIAKIATGRSGTIETAFLSELLTGDFGADRIDYLIRDSYHLGVQYGRFDAPRLLNTIHVRFNSEKKGPELALESGGLHTVEGFLLARYFMFLDVYYHKTRRVLDQHLSEFIKDNLDEGFYPVDLDKYLEWDDAKVIELLKDKNALLVAQRLTARKHLRMTFETDDHPAPSELVLFNWLKEHLETKYNSEQIFFDAATKSPYSFDRPPIFVLVGGEYKPLTQLSALVRQLKKIEKCRVYTEKSLRSQVEKYCRDFWRERNKRGDK